MRKIRSLSLSLSLSRSLSLSSLSLSLSLRAMQVQANVSRRLGNYQAISERCECKHMFSEGRETAGASVSLSLSLSLSLSRSLALRVPKGGKLLDNLRAMRMSANVSRRTGDQEELARSLSLSLSSMFPEGREITGPSQIRYIFHFPACCEHTVWERVLAVFLKLPM